MVTEYVELMCAQHCGCCHQSLPHRDGSWHLMHCVPATYHSHHGWYCHAIAADRIKDHVTHVTAIKYLKVQHTRSASHQEYKQMWLCIHDTLTAWCAVIA